MPSCQTTKAMCSAIDRHFAGTISRDAERAMRRHLDDCTACRRYYHRQLIVESALGPPIGVKDRLAIGLGLRTRSRRWAPMTAAATLALAALVIALAVRPLSRRDASARDDLSDAPTPIQTAEMTARGSNDAVVAFRIRGSEHEPVGHLASIAATDELAFAYAASGTHPYLAVFGVDESGQFYWYFPAWLDAKTVPTVLHVAPTEQLVELSEAVRHDLRGHHLWIYAAFLDRPWTTVEIEARAGRPGAAITIDRPIEPRYSVEVTP